MADNGKYLGGGPAAQGRFSRPGWSSEGTRIPAKKASAMGGGSRVRAYYVPNHKSFGEFMLSPQVVEVAMKAARDVVFHAIANVHDSDPQDKGAGDGTSYRDHFEVTPDVVTIDGNPRAAATVINDADYAAQVEFGIGPGWKGGRVQGGTPGTPQRPLGTAGARVGKYLGGPPG